MTNLTATRQLSSFRAVAATAFLRPPSSFLIVGDELLVSGSLMSPVKKPMVVALGRANGEPPTISEYQRLFAKAEKLGTRTVANFTFRKSVLARLKKLAKELNSTHVRIFSHEDRGIVARLFDVRIGSDVLLPRIKRIHASATFDIQPASENQFSFTLSIESVNLLPADDLLVSVCADGVIEAEPVNTKFAYRFVFRDQGICEPYTAFQHETLGRTVYFVSHPSG